MKMLCVLVFPFLRRSLQSIQQIFSFQLHSPNQVLLIHIINFLFDLTKMLQNFLVFLKSWVFLFECLELGGNRIGVKPFVLVKLLEEVIHFISGSLDRSREQKNDLHDFFILSNHFVKRPLVLTIFILLLPVIEIL